MLDQLDSKYIKKIHRHEYGLRRAIKSLYSTGELHDFKILVNGNEFKVHKLILAARSPVFRRMLSGNFRETEMGFVEIVDFSEKVVDKMITYLYSNELDVNCEAEGDRTTILLDLLLIASKYQVDCLMSECSRKLMGMINYNTSASIKRVAILLGLVELEEACIKNENG